MNFLTKILEKIKMIFLTKINCEISSKSKICLRANVKGCKKIKIQDNSLIESYSVLLANGDKDKGISIGKGCIIHEFAYIKCFDGEIVIGNNTTINSFCLLYGCEGGIYIGNGVRIATGCSLVANSHIFEDVEKYIYQQGVTSKGIVIEDDVWLGAGVRVIDGVTIGKGSVIGANAVVTRSIPQYSVAVGVPAKVIKKRCS